jgi:hypothetical protein
MRLHALVLHWIPLPAAPRIFRAMVGIRRTNFVITSAVGDGARPLYDTPPLLFVGESDETVRASEEDFKRSGLARSKQSHVETIETINSPSITAER